ncbi:MAG: DUF1573 domain-containing protein [Bacteroidetes bacterium]|nr:DUF1573 domain-containing protein [Bacteroidota bacterium]
MKKILLALLFVIGTLGVIRSQDSATPNPDPNAPDMKFDSEVIDFGTIDWDANGVREFKFTNAGKSPLTITSVQGECGCTSTTIEGKPGWPQEPILPGKGGVIKIKYDTKREGRFEKNITVFSNAKYASKRVRIKGEIKAKPASADGK